MWIESPRWMPGEALERGLCRQGYDVVLEVLAGGHGHGIMGMAGRGRMACAHREIPRQRVGHVDGNRSRPIISDGRGVVAVPEFGQSHRGGKPPGEIMPVGQ